jgi:plastocyanin
MRSSLRKPLGTTVAAATVWLAVAGCAASDEAAPADSTSTTTSVAVNAGAVVEIAGSPGGAFSYDPSNRSVKVGETVTWVNKDATRHTVTADSGQTVSFKSPTMTTDSEFVQTFAEPGTYGYFCSIHGAGKMSGTITVE